jgi:hypothetical protein
MTIKYTNSKKDFFDSYLISFRKLFWNKIVVSFSLTFLVIFFDNLKTFPDLRIFGWSFQYFLIVFILFEYILFIMNFFIILKEKQHFLPKELIFEDNKISLDTTYDKKDYRWEALNKVFETKNIYVFLFKDLSRNHLQLILPKNKLSQNQNLELKNLLKLKNKIRVKLKA